jgi:hypothetical protein
MSLKILHKLCFLMAAKYFSVEASSFIYPPPDVGANFLLLCAARAGKDRAGSCRRFICRHNCYFQNPVLFLDRHLAPKSPFKIPERGKRLLK